MEQVNFSCCSYEANIGSLADFFKEFRGEMSEVRDNIETFKFCPLVENLSKLQYKSTLDRSSKENLKAVLQLKYVEIVFIRSTFE